MPEKDRYEGTFRLSPALTRMLMSGQLTPTAAEQIERASNTYLCYDKDTFGGVLHYPVGKGPLTPLDYPQNDKDRLPVVQAIANIGSQYYYHNFLYQGLANGNLHPAKMFDMDMLPIFTNPDGSGIVLTDSQPNRVQWAAMLVGDKIARYPAYIYTISHGGDSDFFNSIRDGLFSTTTQIGSQVKSYIERAQLGINEDTIRFVLYSWSNLDRVYGEMFNNTIIRMCKNKQLPEAISKILLKAAPYRKLVNSAVTASVIMESGLRDKTALTNNMELVEHNFSSYSSEDDMKTVIEAAKQFADNLKIMYDTARTFRADVYDYD